VASFQLPDPAGRAGGACTSALLNTLYAEHTAPTNDLTWIETLGGMREMLKEKGYEQIPQLSSSRMVDVSDKMYIAPPGCTGKLKAVLIGINYVGQQGELSGCHNDVHNIKEYIMDVHGFKEEDMTVLMDDGEHMQPTRDNILKAIENLTESMEEGDAAFFHYSGHGGKVKDTSGDEEDGYDETLIPLDYQDAGQIKDDDIYKCMVMKMPKGTTLTCLMDCCHSGSVLDLPYKFSADGESTEMQFDESFNISHLIDLSGLAEALLKGDKEKAIKMIKEAAKDAAKGWFKKKFG
jgi:hypothetical protein